MLILLMVYNAEENSGAVKQKQKELQVSPSRVAIGKWVWQKRRRNLCFFDLGKYAPIYYRTVRTYSREQFGGIFGNIGSTDRHKFENQMLSILDG